MTTELLRTPLHDWHIAHGGRMVDFAGWSMPVQYTSIVEEHHATRNAVGVFDISHMGRIAVLGTGAASWLDGIVTRRVTDTKPGQIRYSLVCNENGGILDDVLVYRYLDNTGNEIKIHAFDLVVNASNRQKIVNWFNERATDSIQPMTDYTQKMSMFAVQGPAAIELISRLVDCNLKTMHYYTCALARFQRVKVLISRTGYTGEDGCELICMNEDALAVWETIMNHGKSVGATPAGLGARDTLRLEAAMPLYGHELSETINPIQAGLGFAVNLKDRKFIGSDPLARFAADTSHPVRIGLELAGKRVPRQGCPVLHKGAVVGEVTSGTFSPTLEKPIAMAYVQPTAQAIGTNLQIDIRGTHHPATVVPLPFYQRKKN